MKNNLFKILFSIIIVIIINLQSIAQTSQPQMADAFYANGKIYVVVGVLSIVLIGIVLYLFALDRKLTAIEKRLK
ncbi:MAG: CcmD family protein [Bacteroidia bacterium]